MHKTGLGVAQPSHIVPWVMLVHPGYRKCVLSSPMVTAHRPARAGDGTVMLAVLLAVSHTATQFVNWQAISFQLVSKYTLQ